MTPKKRKKVFKEGYDAYFNGVVANPYDEDTEAASAWASGWFEAETDDWEEYELYYYGDYYYYDWEEDYYD